MVTQDHMLTIWCQDVPVTALSDLHTSGAHCDFWVALGTIAFVAFLHNKLFKIIFEDYISITIGILHTKTFSFHFHAHFFICMLNEMKKIYILVLQKYHGHCAHCA